VDQVSTADDQDALVAQRRKCFAKLEMEGGGLGFVYAQLHDRNIGLRIGMHEHRPSPVIEPPGVVESDRQGCQQLLDAAGELRVTRRGILVSHHTNLFQHSHEIVK